MKHQIPSIVLLSCAIFLALSNLHQVTSSIVEITEAEGGEQMLSVISSKPETTYYGKLGLGGRGWGAHTSLHMEYKAGETFCFYSPVVGMRNFTAHALLEKYWDADVKFTLSNSEGELIAESNPTVIGKRSPYAVLRFNEIPRPDILQICIFNLGSSKTIYQGVHLSKDSDIQKFIQTLDNLTATHNQTLDTLARVADRIATLAQLSKADLSTIMQDYRHLTSVSSWVDRRCIVCSLLVLFCGISSTAVIRRWFGSPRSSV